MALSFSRSWFAALAGLLIWLALWLRLQNGWWASLLDSVELLKPAIETGRMQNISKIAFYGHAGAGVVGFTLGWMLYVTREGSVSMFFMRCWQKRGFRWLARLAPVAAIFFWVMVIKNAAPHHTRDEDDAAPLTVAAGEMPSGSDKSGSITRFERRETKFCEFIFKSSQINLAEPLISMADANCRQALAAFDKEGIWPGKLVVDLSSEVASHAAAQTYWTKIRFPLRPGMSREQLANILRHEVTHVIIEQISDGQASQHFDSMRAFHEGMGTYVETSSFNQSAREERQHQEIAAALSWSRGEVPLSKLLNDDGLKQSRDEFLVYPMGLIFIEALIDVGGKNMPLTVLQTLKNHPPPAGVRGKDLWQYLLNHTGHSMSHLDAAYEVRMADLMKKHEELIALLPKLTAEVCVEKENIIIRPGNISLPAGWKIVCVVEPRFGILRQRRNLIMKSDGTFHLPRADHREAHLRYMLGWFHAGDRHVTYEPWQATNLPAASP